MTRIEAASRTSSVFCLKASPRTAILSRSRVCRSSRANSTTLDACCSLTSSVAVFPRSTEILAVLAPFIQVQFGPLPAYELLVSSGLTYSSATNATLAFRNNGTLPVTLTRYYSITSAAFSGQYNGTSPNGATLATGSTAVFGVLTDSPHSFRAGYCYGIAVFTLGDSQFLFISCD
jgi:hypothetical protein